MSLFRPDCLHIGLEPDRATVLRVAGARKPRVLADAMVPLTLDPRAPQLAPLFDSLAAPAFKARDVRFVLADSLVRYFVTEAPRGIRNRAELRDVLTSRFEEQFGLAASDWEISADLEPGSQSYLACAAPRTLIDSLRSACLGARLRMLGIRPFAVSELNRWHRRLPGHGFWFAAAGQHSLTLGYRGKEGWRGMRSHPVGAELAAQLPLLAERDALRHGVSEAAKICLSGLVGHPVDGPASPNLAQLGAGLWPGRNEAWSRNHRLALSGIWP